MISDAIEALVNKPGFKICLFPGKGEYIVHPEMPLPKPGSLNFMATSRDKGANECAIRT